MAKFYRFVQVDVFTDRPFAGNQLAVFTDARGLDRTQMQRLAREMNFAESTFVLPAEDAQTIRRVRIFTPTMEMRFAGHPTIGTAYVLMKEGVIQTPRACLGEKIGPVEVWMDADETVWMAQRLPKFGLTFHYRDALARALGLRERDLEKDLPARVVSTGVPFLFVPVRSLDAMARIEIDGGVVKQICAAVKAGGFFVFSRDTVFTRHTVHARMFAPELGVVEDAATGSACGPLGAYLVKYGLVCAEDAENIVIEQGYEMLRASLIRVAVRMQTRARFESVRVGGRAVIVGEGRMYV
jgi:trans-2,3-dihydro-3-hydroxyanthranilate isomerase